MVSSKSDSLAKILSEARARAGLSQTQVAEKSEISFRSYQRIESGESSPRFEVLFRIIKTLKIDLSSVLVPIFSTPEFPEKSEIELLLIKSHQQQTPLMVEVDEIQGIKRALSEDFSRGLATFGYWEWNTTTNSFYWSDQMFVIYDMDPNLYFDHSIFIKQISPEDVVRIEYDMANLIHKNVTYKNTHVVRSKYGEFKVRALAKKFAAANGDAIVFGIAERITE